MADAPPPDRRTVLVVDDEPAVRLVVTRLLSEAGYQVFTARSAPEALRVLGTGAPVHVVLSDLRMPQMTGAELATLVEHIRPTTRVLLMAAYPSEDPLAWPVVVKPFAEGQLELEIRRVLDGPDAHAASGEQTGCVE
jgi:CheY-like chemotaxis protein